MNYLHFTIFDGGEITLSGITKGQEVIDYIRDYDFTEDYNTNAFIGLPLLF